MQRGGQSRPLVTLTTTLRYILRESIMDEYYGQFLTSNQCQSNGQCQTIGPGQTSGHHRQRSSEHLSSGQQRMHFKFSCMAASMECLSLMPDSVTEDLLQCVKMANVRKLPKTLSKKRKFDSAESGDMSPAHVRCTPFKHWKISPVDMTTDLLQHQEHMSSSSSLSSCAASTISVDPKLAYLHRGGQLKVAVYNNCGLLTIHVMQARHLTSKWKATCDAYVKMSLVPDDCKRTRCKTNVIENTNHPVFDEKFSFELLDSDKDKRLLLSVWHKDAKKQSVEFLGCMSFGIRKLLASSKSVSGWYFLLTEDIGRRKHLQAVGNPITHLTQKARPRSSERVADVSMYDSFTAVVKRSRGGFGLTLSGRGPVHITRVEEGSFAASSGLRQGDTIVRINGQNVTCSTADKVAKIIRYSEKQIVIDVQRPERIQTLDSSPRKTQQEPTNPRTAAVQRLFCVEGEGRGEASGESSHDTTSTTSDLTLPSDVSIVSLEQTPLLRRPSKLSMQSNESAAFSDEDAGVDLVCSSTPDHSLSDRSSLSKSASLCSVSGISLGDSRMDAHSLLGSGQVDSELLDLRKHLNFAAGVQRIEIASEGRHVIYSGELLLHTVKRWQKVWGILFSDLLLLTRAENDGSLTVLTDPVPLTSISAVNFDLKDSTEFVISTNTRKTSARELIVKAPTMEHKFVWRSILACRLSVSRTKRHPLPRPAVETLEMSGCMDETLMDSMMDSCVERWDSLL